MILGIDGGATATKAALIDELGRLCSRGRGAPSNAVLQTEDQIYAVLKDLWESVAPQAQGLRAVAICLAGAATEKQQSKVEATAKLIWPDLPIFVSHDLRSGLYAGAPSGEGVVVISGTGASVFARRGTREIRGGGWGHVLGDAGSGYHIAHMGLRNITAQYDRHAKLDALGKRILRATGARSLEELASFISRTEKPRIAELSKCVFAEAASGNRDARRILGIAASALASNVTAVVRRLGGRSLPIFLTGGVFDQQERYRALFARKLREELPWARPALIPDQASLGAARWGLQCLSKLKKASVRNRNTPKAAFKKLLSNVDMDQIATEESNPRTRQLSTLATNEAVELFLSEDEAILPALRKASAEIARAVDLCSACLEKGGRLIYVGAGTSGRLGVLDASECPPTFRSRPGQVVALIAGGRPALEEAVEGAEDDTRSARVALKELKLNATDCVVGIAASGRTPFVLSALSSARRVGAASVFLSCNPNLSAKPSIADVEIHLSTGPEVLTGSTRLKAGTATKMVLNILSTLSMVKLGKVVGNVMIDLHPSNDKLKMRALKIFMGLTGFAIDRSYTELENSNWNLRLALHSSGSSHLCQMGFDSKTST
jgi:N-acetylmuramic acid 6-phosphate etherase